MRYADDVREYVYECRFKNGESFNSISERLNIPWDVVHNMFTYERSLRDGSLKIIKAGDPAKIIPDVVITLEEILAGGKRHKTGNFSYPPKKGRKSSKAITKDSILEDSEIRTPLSSASKNISINATGVIRNTAITTAGGAESEKIKEKEESGVKTAAKISFLGESTKEVEIHNEGVTNDPEPKAVETLKVKLTKNDREDTEYQIILLYTIEALSPREIAAKVNRSYSNVISILERNNIKIRKIKRSLDRKDLFSIKERLAKGDDKRVIAQDLGYSVSLIDEANNMADVSAPLIIKLERAVELYTKEAWSLRAIAEEVGCAEVTICKYFKKSQISIRKIVPISTETRSIIARRISEGEDKRKLAYEFACSVQSIDKSEDSLCSDTRHKAKIPEDVTQQVLRLYSEEAFSMKEIERALPASNRSIMSILGRNNVPQRKIRTRMSLPDIAIIRTRLEAGEDKRVIAYDLGYTASMVEKANNSPAELLAKSDGVLDTIKSLYSEKAYSVSDICKELALPFTAIQQYMARMGVSMRKIKSAVSAESYDEIKARLESGESIPKLAFEFDTSYSLIDKIRNSEKKRPVRHKSSGKKSDESAIVEIIQLYTKEAHSTKEISGKVGLCKQAVRKILSNNNILLREIKRSITIIDEERVAAEVLKGRDKVELAYELGYSIGMIEKALVRSATRASESNKKKKSKVPNNIRSVEQLTEKIINLYTKKAFSINEIRKSLRVSVTGIQKVLEDAEIEIRNIKTNVTFEEVDTIKQLVRDGEDICELAYSLGYTSKMIEDALKTETVNPNKIDRDYLAPERLNGIPLKIKKSIIDDYIKIKDSTISSLSRGYKVPRNSVARILANAGIPTKKKESQQETKLGIHAAHKIQMYSLQQNGKLVEEIVKEFPQYEEDKIISFLLQDLNASWLSRTQQLLNKKYPFTRLEDSAVEKVINFRKEEKTIEEIAHLTGNTDSIIRKILRTLNLSYPQGKTNYVKETEFDKTKAEQLYKSGNSLRVVANELKVPIGSIRSHLAKIGLIGGPKETSLEVINLKSEVQRLSKCVEEHAKVIESMKKFFVQINVEVDELCDKFDIPANGEMK